MYVLEYFDVRDEKWHEAQIYGTRLFAESGFDAARAAMKTNDPLVKWWSKLRIMTVHQLFERENT